MDSLSSDARSKLMARVRGKNTKPEMVVRRTLWRLGLRYRLHVAGLPGRPDIVLPKHRLTIFVHGCFWHRHAGCRKSTTPKSNESFWQAKFAANVARDQSNVQALEASGWTVATVWECEASAPERWRGKLGDILEARGVRAA